MWCKTITTTFNKKKVQVLVFLYDSLELGKEVVRVQTMVNEYYLIQDVIFSSRDAAHEYIEHYPVSMANSFVKREAYLTGAVL